MYGKGEGGEEGEEGEEEEREEEEEGGGKGKRKRKLTLMGHPQHKSMREKGRNKDKSVGRKVTSQENRAHNLQWKTREI